MILIHGFFLAVIPWVLVRSHFALSLRSIGYFQLISIPLVILGAAFYVSSVSDFVRFGNGTLAAWDSPTEFVLRGGYRSVRNPMYVGMFLILASEAVFFRSARVFLYGIILWISFHLFVVYHEEPVLRKKFGNVYEDYLRSVPRWIPLFRNPKAPR